MPRWWNSTARWAEGLAVARPVLREYTGILQHYCVDEAASSSTRGLGVHAAQWLADVAAWLLHLILGLILAGW
eukprot:5454223-Pyramimonas_sp.AAC.1